MPSLLETAQSGDLALLTERLTHVVSSIGGGTNRASIDEQLLQEALWYARHDDLEEATLRLRLRSRPKFRSERESEIAYKKAMKEKRARKTA